MIKDSGRVEGIYRGGQMVWKELTPPLIEVLGEEWFQAFLADEEDLILDGRRLSLKNTEGGEDVLEEGAGGNL